MTIKKQIYYHDTDAGAVVYYGRYLQFLEESRTQFLENKGLSIAKLHEMGFLYAVRECNIKYHKPARYGDIILCNAALSQITAATLTFEQTIHLEKTGDLLVSATVNLVSLTKDFKPTPILPEVKAKISA